MRNIHIITLEKMENNECDIYSKTQGFRTQIAPLNLNRLTRKDCSLLQVCIHAATHLST